jgi:hypothetical protein
MVFFMNLVTSALIVPSFIIWIKTFTLHHNLIHELCISSAIALTSIISLSHKMIERSSAGIMRYTCQSFHLTLTLFQDIIFIGSSDECSVLTVSNIQNLLLHNNLKCESHHHALYIKTETILSHEM